MAQYDKDLVVRPRLPDRPPRSFRTEVQQVDPAYANKNVPGYVFPTRTFIDRVTKEGY